jgi:acetoin utilization deacetylase AcuC-like enzyme
MPHMPLDLPVVWDEACLLHEPGGEIWVGIRTPGTEVPERALVLRSALMAAGSSLVPAAVHDDALIDAVHSPHLTGWLREAWDGWTRSGLPLDPGQDRVVPYVFPTAGLLGTVPVREPAATQARAGAHCYDTMTLVGPGTWAAARAAVDVALTAADLVTAGAPTAYALCRPPGHHASRDGFGGSCYLNNAAIAAESLRAAGATMVAVVDIDAHHGNGTQAIFYDRADVGYASLHVDPAAGWFPHWVGHADEQGSGAGAGRNLNVPLAPGTADAGWLSALDRIVERVTSWRPDVVVLSGGYDAAADDPESPLQVSANGYREAGRRLAGLAPLVAVQEGGYHLPTLGALAVAFAEGMQETTNRSARMA